MNSLPVEKILTIELDVFKLLAFSVLTIMLFKILK